MVIPDRDLLRALIAPLIDQPYDSANPGGFAAKVLSAGLNHEPDAVNAAFTYLQTVSIDALQAYHGEPEPDRGQVVILRFHLQSLRDAVEKGDLPLPSSQIDRLSRYLGERDAYMSDSAISRPSFDSANVRRPSQELLSRSEPIRTSRTSYSGEFPRAPASSASWDKPRDEEPGEFDVLGQPIRRNDAPYYVFSAMTLGAAVFLTLEALESRWPVWIKLALSAGIPVGVLVFVAMNKSLKVLKYLKTLLVAGSLVMLVGATAYYSYSMYRRVTTLNRLDEVARDMELTSSALHQYLLKEKIYPRDLESLFSPVDYFKGTRISSVDDLFDPFFPAGTSYSYQRTLDSYMLQSPGPSGKLVDVVLPTKASNEFATELEAFSYDPTNGLYSQGNIFYLPRQR